MLENFKHKGLKRLYWQGDPSGIGPTIRKRVTEILTLLNVASRPADMDIPGYRLHPLTGKLKGLWSVRVSGNWRIIFRFDNEHIRDVDLVDYH